MFRDCFAEWFRKSIVNRRLLRRVFTIGIEFSEHFKSLRGNREKSEFNLLRDIVIAWRALSAARMRSRKAKMGLVSRKMVYEAGLISSVFLAWQRHCYCKAVSREFREDVMMKMLKASFAGWERWSYRVIRVRWKWSVRKVQEWSFKLFRMGCDVKRIERKVVSRRVWGRWVRRWERLWKQEPVEMYESSLMKKIWREWTWYLAELGVER